jgi:O-antigen/teichoic acid export membrane protein
MIFAEDVVHLIIGSKTGGNTVEDIALVIRVISLSVLIIPFLSVSKGYLQGHKFIWPTSVSQMIEQVIRIIVVVGGSFIAIKLLKESVTVGVAVAVAGSFVGGLFAILYIVKKIIKNKDKLDLNNNLKKDKISNKEIIKKILTYAIPFIIINITVNFFNIVDMTFIIRTLSNMGYSGETSEFVASAMTTWGYKLNMIVNAVATGLTVSLIPNIVSAYTLGKTKTVNNIFNKALQIVLFVSMPCAIGLSFLAYPVWNIFYGVSELGPVIFKMSILTAIFCNVYLISLQTAQAINEYKTVYKGVIIGFSMNAIFDVPFMYLCKYVGLPPFYGATFATMLGYIVAIGIIIHRLLKIKDVTLKDTIKVFCKLILCILAMLFVLTLLKLVFPYTYRGKMFAIMYVAIFAIVGAVVYFVLTYKLGLIDKILGKKMINKILNKVTLGKVKIKDDGNDNQED